MRPRKEFSGQSRDELRDLLAVARSVAEFKRVQAVWLRAVLDLSADQIALATGLSVASIRCYHSRYLKFGKVALVGKQRGGRRHQNLSLEDERALLERFVATAERGGVLEVSRIHAAYEQLLGRVVPNSTIYRLLARHGWRKIAPRPQHPQGDAGRRQTFKKNFPRSWKLR
jgi:transposase